MVSVGDVIGGRFRVDAELGAGGMGLVVAATHVELGNRVAIKLLRPEMAERPTVVERFLREARAVAQLRTEHVCRVLDVARPDGAAPYIVMELLDGADLGQTVARGPLPVTMAVEYVMQACVALAEAHAAGIVHRDIKPANLFVTRRPGGGPLIKVLDFGIAKALAEPGAPLTRTQGAMGSPAYMSPEQLQSARDVDARADVWSLGVTLYQLLAARLPFYRAVVTEMAVRIAVDQPDPLDVDPALRATIWRCLEKAPAARFAGVAELAAALVPFGGPSARAIAAHVASIAAGVPVAPPDLGLHAPPPYGSPPYAAPPSYVSPPGPPATAPYAASSATPGSPAAVQPTTPGSLAAVPASQARPPTAPPAPARSSRWWLAGLAVLAVAGVGAAVVALAARGSSAGSHDAAVAPIAHDAAIAAPPDAAAPPVDAATVDADIDPWASPPEPHRDAGVPAPEPHRAAGVPAPAPPPRRPHVPAAPGPRGMPPGYLEQMRQGCQQLLRPQVIDRAPPMSVAMCHCVLHDAARAAAAAAKLDPAVRGSLRQQCAVLGTRLP
jgi:serine/threonine-protein kinase